MIASRFVLNFFREQRRLMLVRVLDGKFIREDHLVTFHKIKKKQKVIKTQCIILYFSEWASRPIYIGC